MASDAAELSGYNKIDFTIDENSTVLKAVQRFVAHNIGCLVTVNSRGDLTGIISERDCITKVELLDRTNEIKIKEIYTPKEKLITAKPDESVEHCMEKMLASDIRHLPLVKCNKLLGMVSIKDLVKTTVQEKEETIRVLTNLTLGKGSYAI
ncbi:CBS-domain-containing protein [Fragilariopsis cylindrus CCMP1102]|uniref:CBS-domain-containing protein n=1 Tax=Fragilariopsis cylindrus CCMP1102 TaxID=635003 RepID=A0A1E7FHU2_9STRA|nr:CBS-domain-containing protein [Fragilariopsis cylindrus CCMP1102]|eukprot:OEU17707.1 CBS-domain-containing protein [Fragilariopsis cylindrus CCMP1102]